MGNRIREERERMGWSQQAAANAVGIRREMWAKYEAGSEPGAKALAGMTAAGVDIIYILTGKRQTETQPISTDDHALLQDFHAAPVQVREGVKTALSAFSPQSVTSRNRDSA